MYSWGVCSHSLKYWIFDFYFTSLDLNLAFLLIFQFYWFNQFMYWRENLICLDWNCLYQRCSYVVITNANKLLFPQSFSICLVSRSLFSWFSAPAVIFYPEHSNGIGQNFNHHIILDPLQYVIITIVENRSNYL